MTAAFEHVTDKSIVKKLILYINIILYKYKYAEFKLEIIDKNNCADVVLISGKNIR